MKSQKSLGPCLQIEITSAMEDSPCFPCLASYTLQTYKETDAHGPSFIQPAAELIEGEEEYEVEAIIGHKRRGKGKQYLIKWLGYPTLENCGNGNPI